MPGSDKKKITLSAREGIRFVNNRDHLFFCVEIGPYHFAVRALCPQVSLGATKAIFTKTSEDHQYLTAYFPVGVPQRGKLTYGFPGEDPELVLSFDFEKKRPTLLDRSKISKKVVEVNAATFKRKQS